MLGALPAFTPTEPQRNRRATGSNRSVSVIESLHFCRGSRDVLNEMAGLISDLDSGLGRPTVLLNPVRLIPTDHRHALGNLSFRHELERTGASELDQNPLACRPQSGGWSNKGAVAHRE